MARLRHAVTGVIVNVSDEKASALRGSFVSADEPRGDAEVPTQSATKGDWVAFAVEQGLTESDAENKTKSELIEQFG